MQNTEKSLRAFQIKLRNAQRRRWLPRDLRHNFAAEIVRVTDMETSRSLAGHAGNHILTYLHANEKRRREEMNKREGKEIKVALTELYKEIKNGNIETSRFS